MHEWLSLKLWSFTMLGMLAVAISVPGQTPPCDANSQARAALALAQTPPPTGSAQNAPPIKNDYSFSVKKKKDGWNPCGIRYCDCGCLNGLTCTCKAQSAKCKCDCGCDKQQECTCEHCIACVPMSYAAGYKLALETGKPLIVFLDQATRPIAGCIVCRDDGWPNTRWAIDRGVIVAKSDGKGNLLRIGDLYDVPTDDEIRRVLSCATQVQSPPIPKGGTRPSVQLRGRSGRSC